MNKLITVVNVFIIAVAIGCQGQTAPVIKADAVFRNVNIIDVVSGKVVPGQDVYITDDRIVDITPTGKIPTAEIDNVMK